jgi:uncharacterized protein (TIGR02996 family)
VEDSDLSRAKDVMTGSRDALYRAICASPDEDTPRLAFADLVEEEGDAARAAFVRAQVALARVPDYDPLAVSARQGDPGALTGHGMAHTLPKVSAAYTWNSFEFRRGFPWKIGVRSGEAFDAAGAIFEAAPVQSLDLGARGRLDIDALADWPHLARLRQLEFSRTRFGADDAERLGHSPHAAGLTQLTFEFDGITAEGLESLARSPLFPRLTSLDLRSNVIPPALLVDALAAARAPGSLARLSLGANHLTGHDAAHLFALPVMRDLQHLDLSDNPDFGVAGAKALAESGVLRGLRALDLERTHPGVPGVEALTETGALAGVRSLNLSANRLGPNAVKRVARSESARGLRVLNLSENLVGDAGAAALADSKALAGLLELNLERTGMTDLGALALAESPHLDNLLRLNLTSATERPLGSDARDALLARFGNRVAL